MNKISISRFMIMMLVSMLTLIVSQAQQNEYDLTNSPTNFALSNWYACNYGDYQPACDEAGIATVSSNALSNWYACTYGDYQPACDAINKPLNSHNIT